MYGMTITDAFILAKYSAGTNAEVQKMTIREFAFRVAYDMWNRKLADEPRNQILDGVLNSPDLSTVGVGGVRGSELQTATPQLLSWYDIQESHQISLTEQRDGNGKPCRRACIIKSKGCESVGDAKKTVSSECKNPACISITNSSKNMHGQTKGTFICSNFACQKEHWDRIAQQVRGALELESN